MSTSNVPSELDHDACFRKQVIDGFVTAFSSDQDKLDQLISIRSFSLKFIQDASRRDLEESGAVKKGLDVLWYMFIETAKAFDKDDPFQDKLVLLLLWTKELDSLRRGLHSNESATETWDFYGFHEYLQTSFEQVLTTGTVSQQCNLAVFAAKALEVGICRHSIGLIALWCMREVLETGDEAKAVSLLPISVAWLRHSSYSLLTFSALKMPSADSYKADSLSPGTFAQHLGVDEQGFSVERWLCWRQRLQELSHNTDLAVAKEASQGFMDMISRGRELDFDVPGEAKFKEKLQATMWEALVKSGKESLSGDDINIKVDWVD